MSAARGSTKSISKASEFRLYFPDYITALNLVSGVFALYAAILGDVRAASLLVAAAMVFDYFDGKIARYLKQEHVLGMHLDSLSDMVSFGIAPGVIALVTYRLDYVILGAAALYACAGAYRLARFNIVALSEEKTTSFVGVPIPAAALLVLVSLLLGLPVIAQAAVLVLAAILMVATFRVKKL